jgi:hypothetical protein
MGAVSRLANKKSANPPKAWIYAFRHAAVYFYEISKWIASEM